MMMEEACSGKGLASLESHHRQLSCAESWLIRILEAAGNLYLAETIPVHLGDYDGLFGFEPAHDDTKLIHRATEEGRVRFVDGKPLY
jgi:hypothetical protein